MQHLLRLVISSGGELEGAIFAPVDGALHIYLVEDDIRVIDVTLEQLVKQYVTTHRKLTKLEKESHFRYTD